MVLGVGFGFGFDFGFRVWDSGFVFGLYFCAFQSGLDWVSTLGSQEISAGFGIWGKGFVFQVFGVLVWIPFFGHLRSKSGAWRYLSSEEELVGESWK